MGAFIGCTWSCSRRFRFDTDVGVRRLSESSGGREFTVMQRFQNQGLFRSTVSSSAGGCLSYVAGIVCLVYATVAVAEQTEQIPRAGVATWDDLAMLDAASDPSIPKPARAHRRMPAPRVRDLGVRSSGDVGTDEAFQDSRPALQVYGPVGGTNFQALGDDNSSIPPDTMGAAGPSHVMTMLNTQVRIQTKAGANVSTVSLTSFWSPAGCPGGDVFDPRIVYDQGSGRWLACTACDAFVGTSSIMFAISATNNPTGAWSFFRIDGDAGNTTFVDFPDLGFNNTWVAMTANMFNNVTDAFEGNKMWVIQKSTALSGGPLTVTTFATGFDLAGGAEGFALRPCTTFGAEATLYIVDNPFVTFGGVALLRLSRITGTGPAPVWSVVPGSAFAGSGLFAVSNNFNLTQQDAAQLGTALRLDSGEPRVLNAVFRNTRVWCTHSGGLPASGAANRTAVYWYQLNPTSAAAPIVQSGVIDGGSGVHHFYPSIAANANNDVCVGFSRSDAGRFAEAVSTGRLAADPVNTMGPITVLKAGEDSYVKTFGQPRIRWGDYSATCIDPTNDLDFWTIQEYAETDVGAAADDDRWGTWWGNKTTVVVTGACCASGTLNCSITSAATCTSAGGTYLGDGTTCLLPPNNVDACDCNNNNILDATEIGGGGGATLLSEGFDSVAGLTGAGWVMINRSQALGAGTWFQGNSMVFAAHMGAANAYVGVNFDSAADGAGADTISNWLLTPTLTLENGVQLSFFTRTVTTPAFPDRLQVRMSLNGASTNVGATAVSEGDFTTLLLDINPTLTTVGYPNTFTQFMATLSGIGSPTTGRLAFRYFVTDGGPTGANSDYIGLDTLTVAAPPGPPPNDCNTNDILDECDIASCPMADPNCDDCNNNLVPDECDIAQGTSADANMNGIPDSCETNFPPVVNAGPNQNALEGNLVGLAPATYMDANPADTHTATINWGDGSATQAGTVNNMTDTVSGSHRYADNGVYTVTVTVTDNLGLPGNDTLLVTVANVPPTVSAGPDQMTTVGAAINLQSSNFMLNGVLIPAVTDKATFGDPGFDFAPAPTVENFTATVDWGDGTIETTGGGMVVLVETPGSAGVPTTGTVTASHAYTSTGPFLVAVTVTDDDLQSGSDTFQVTVDPAIPTVSQWGLVVMTMTLLTAGTLVFRRRVWAQWQP